MTVSAPRLQEDEATHSWSDAAAAPDTRHVPPNREHAQPPVAAAAAEESRYRGSSQHALAGAGVRPPHHARRRQPRRARAREHHSAADDARLCDKAPRRAERAAYAAAVACRSRGAWSLLRPRHQPRDDGTRTRVPGPCHAPARRCGFCEPQCACARTSTSMMRQRAYGLGMMAAGISLVVQEYTACVGSSPTLYTV